MDVHQPLALLAGLSPAQFMRRHWQKKPLVVRRAIAGFQPQLDRAALMKMAAREDVESRLIVQSSGGWTMKKGPFPAKSLPRPSQPGWTLLLQGMDLHDQTAHELLRQFSFVPSVRLDDVMVSFATPGGGVGPHFDSYDVFLFQASGQRRWRISRQKDLRLQAGVPLKILENFVSDEEFVLNAGDMLYLPPRYAHDGVAEAGIASDGKAADCMTYSIGFRAPARSELASELLRRLADMGDDANDAAQEAGSEQKASAARKSAYYRDPQQPATVNSAALPSALGEFAAQTVRDALKDPLALACALGEYLSEPKPGVWFDAAESEWQTKAARLGLVGVALDARSLMLYDDAHIFINGESYRANGADARLMRRLADQRYLDGRDLVKASTAALALLADWHEAGWLHQVANNVPAVPVAP